MILPVSLLLYYKRVLGAELRFYPILSLWIIYTIIIGFFGEKKYNSISIHIKYHSYILKLKTKVN